MNYPSFFNYVDDNLFVSSFSASNAHVYMIPEFSSYLKNQKPFSQINIQTLEQFDDVLLWPNEIGNGPILPNKKKSVFINDGFLVPGKSSGNVWLLTNISSSWKDILNVKPVQIISDSESRDDFFFHRTMLFDMDNDGIDELITARAKKPIIGSSEGELLILKGKTENLKYSIKTSFSGPDIFFDIARLPNKKSPIIVSAQFFSNQVMIHWSENDNWYDQSSIKSVSIDSDLAQPFDVQFIDMNGDGKLEIVVSYYQDEIGYVAIYEIPDSFDKEFKKHIIASGFQPKGWIKIGKMSPGMFVPFKFIHLPYSKKVTLLLSGDDDGCYYLVSPSSEDPNDFNYKTEKILESGSTPVSAPFMITNDKDQFIILGEYKAGLVNVYSC